MMKKIALLNLVFVGNLVANQFSDQAKAIGVTAVTASAFTACWMYDREANSSLVDKVDRFWRHTTENIAKTRPEDFSRMILVFKEFDIFVFDLHKKMNSRYASWMTPWNWHYNMRQAHLRITLLEILFRYLDTLASWHNTISDAAVLQLAEKMGYNSGAVINFVDQLNADILKIDKLSKELHCNFATILKNHLVAIKDMTKRSNAYAQERTQFV